MSLIAHAKYELEKAGLLDKDSDYGGMLGHSIMELIEVFSKQNHSGFSANRTISLFQALASFKTLTPITSDPNEWFDVSEQSGLPMWQNKRDGEFFSKDGGKTWYSLNDRRPIKDV